MKCSNCGTEIKDCNICPKCGLNKLDLEENVTGVLEKTANADVENNSAKNNNKRGSIILIIILIIIVIAVACGLFFCRNLFVSKKNVSNNTTTVSSNGNNGSLIDSVSSNYLGFKIGLPDNVVASLTSDGFFNIKDIDKNYNFLIKLYDYNYDDAKKYLNSADYLEAVTVSGRTILNSPSERTINGLKTFVVSYSNPDYLVLIYETLIVEFDENTLMEFDIIYDSDKVTDDDVDSTLENILKNTKLDDSSSSEKLSTNFETTINENVLNN